jgi:hypothetical protein
MGRCHRLLCGRHLIGDDPDLPIAENRKNALGWCDRHVVSLCEEDVRTAWHSGLAPVKAPVEDAWSSRPTPVCVACLIELILPIVKTLPEIERQTRANEQRVRREKEQAARKLEEDVRAAVPRWLDAQKGRPPRIRGFRGRGYIIAFVRDTYDPDPSGQGSSYIGQMAVHLTSDGKAVRAWAGRASGGAKMYRPVQQAPHEDPAVVDELRREGFLSAE